MINSAVRPSFKKKNAYNTGNMTPILAAITDTLMMRGVVKDDKLSFYTETLVTHKGSKDNFLVVKKNISNNV